MKLLFYATFVNFMMITIVYVHPLKQKSGGGKATPSKFNFPYLNLKKKIFVAKKVWEAT